MTTDNTQEHMHNSGEATSCAQWSAQVELDEILEDFYDGNIRQSDMGKAKYAILDWHNKQVKNAVATAEDDLDQYWNKELDKQTEAVLDRLLVEVKRAYDREGDFLEMAVDIIEAERNRLNPSKSTPFNKLKESTNDKDS